MSESHEREEEEKTFPSFASHRTVLNQTFEKVDQRYHAANPLLGLPTGLSPLDQVTRGLRPGDLCLVTGLSGTSKSAFCRMLALAALQETRCVAVFHPTQSRTEWMAELLSQQARLPRGITEGNFARPEDWDTLASAIQQTWDSHLHVCDTCPISIDTMTASCRTLKEQAGALD